MIGAMAEVVYLHVGAPKTGTTYLQNRLAANQAALAARGVSYPVGPADDMFKSAPEQVDWADNASLDPEPMLWSSVIRASGVDAMLDRLRA